MKTRLLILSLIAAILPLSACSTTGSLADFNAGVKMDLASPQGKQLIASVFASAVSITGAALAEGANIPADVAAADSLGGILEAYSTLPTTMGNLKTLASTAASTSAAVQKASPQIVALIDAATKKGADPTMIIQTVAAGVYAATGVVPTVASI